MCKSTKKRKATEDIPAEDVPASPLQRDANSTIEERKMLPLYVWPRREEALEVNVSTKACSSLVIPQIPAGVPLLMNIIPKLVKLQFEDTDTRKQADLERKNYMITMLAIPPELQLIVSMQWDQGVESTALLNLLPMSHFGRNKQVSTYV